MFHDFLLNQQQIKIKNAVEYIACICMWVIFDMGHILMFEAGFVLQTCNFIIVSLKNIIHINTRNLCMCKCIFDLTWEQI